MWETNPFQLLLRCANPTMQGVTWEKRIWVLFSPHYCYSTRSLLTRLAVSSKEVLSDMGKSTRTWWDFKFSGRHEPPDQRGSHPTPVCVGGCLQRIPRWVWAIPWPWQVPRPAALGQTLPFLPIVCICTRLGHFWCVGCRSDVCPTGIHRDLTRCRVVAAFSHSQPVAASSKEKRSWEKIGTP